MFNAQFKYDYLLLGRLMKLPPGFVMSANTSRRSPRVCSLRGVTCVTHRKSRGPVRPARCPGQRGACVGAVDDVERSPLTAGWCWT